MSSNHQGPYGTDLEVANPQHIGERCPKCGLPKMRGSDSKFRCDNCQCTDNFFQDGDKVDIEVPT